MAYAAFVMWLIMVSASKSQEPKNAKGIVTAIHRAFRRCDWYRPCVFEKIWDSIQGSLPNMKPGPRTGVLIPLTHVIEAANRAGCNLQHTTELEVMMDSAVVMADFLSTAAEPPPKKWWQFWR